jgi:hypothetical protein
MRIPVSNLVTADDATYVALGDSYSSGEGNPPFELGSTPRTRQLSSHPGWSAACI